MRRIGTAIAVLLLSGILAGKATAISVIFSGSTAMVIIDGDGDGPDATDCRYLVDFTDPLLTITPVQDATNPIRACTGTKSGSLFFGSDSSSDFAVADLNTTTSEASGASPPLPPLAGLLNVPIQIELIAESFGPPDGLPLEINQIDLQSLETSQEFATAFVCTAGGPTLQLRMPPGGPAILLPLTPYPSAQNPTHLRVASLPFERAAPNLGSFTFLDVYLPLANGADTAALASSPESLLVNVVLSALRPCAGRMATPTMTEWGLVTLVLAMLALGSWRLGRRRRFYESLPQI